MTTNVRLARTPVMTILTVRILLDHTDAFAELDSKATEDNVVVRNEFCFSTSICIGSVDAWYCYVCCQNNTAPTLEAASYISSLCSIVQRIQNE